MKKLLFVLMGMGMASSSWAAGDFYKIDPAHSFAHFDVDHLNFTTLKGRFDQTDGRLMIDKKNNNGFVQAKIAAVSVNTGFGKRDEHLRSPDFLNVTEFPNIVYESTSLKINADGKTAVVHGNLTLLGTTKPVQLDVTSIRCGINPMNKKETCGFEAKTSIKRSDFGSTYGLPGVGDQLQLWFGIEAIKED